MLSFPMLKVLLYHFMLHVLLYMHIWIIVLAKCELNRKGEGIMCMQPMPRSTACATHLHTLCCKAASAGSSTCHNQPLWQRPLTLMRDIHTCRVPGWPANVMRTTKRSALVQPKV